MKDFINPPSDSLMTRTDIIINNILIKLLDEADFPEEQLIPWLSTEIGMTEEEIEHLKEVGCLPVVA